MIVRQSLFSSVAGSILYSSVLTMFVRGERAIALYGHFRWPNIGDLLGFTLLMTPIAIPTALLITASLAFFPKPHSLRAATGAAIAITALTAILVFAFPIYMTVLDYSNNWQRGALLPVMVCAVAVIMWSFDRRERK